MRGGPLRWSVVGVVAAGGTVGALARFALTTAFPDPATGFPWTVFAINLAGTLVLALLPVLAVVRRHALLPPLLGTGVLGGFTTLSTYSEQTRALVAAGRPGLGATYALGTLAACVLAVALADRLSSRRDRRAFGAEEGEE